MDGKSKTPGIDALIDARARTGLVCLGEDPQTQQSWQKMLAENTGTVERPALGFAA